MSQWSLALLLFDAFLGLWARISLVVGRFDSRLFRSGFQRRCEWIDPFSWDFSGDWRFRDTFPFLIGEPEK